MLSNERELRFDVRTAFSYTVKYEIISQEEYHLIREKADLLPNPDRKKLKILPELSDNNGTIVSDYNNDDHDDALVEFLIKMDEKLDSILSILSINKARSEALNPGLAYLGTGKNISASGISVVTSKPASKGQIIHVNINLCKLPPVCIDAYGEIVRVTCAHDKDIPMFNLGIKFIDLDEKVREKIVAYVFSNQRKAIRSGKIETNQYLNDS